MQKAYMEWIAAVCVMLCIAVMVFWVALDQPTAGELMAMGGR